MIETIVLDLGGVLMEHDIQACVKRFQQLLGANFAKLGLGDDGEPTDVEMPIMRDYETGYANTDDFVKALLPLSKEGTTRQDILDVWNMMLLGIPAERLERVLRLKQHYPVFLLSNNSEEHWRFCVEKFFSSPDCDSETVLHRYFDEVFLSQEMHLSKPDPRIFEQADARIEVQLDRPEHPYNKAHTIFVDDLPANRAAAQAYGWQTCSSLDELETKLYNN